MKRNGIIHSIFAGFMLLVFTLGFTPRKYVHDLLTCHTDYTLHSGQHESQQIATDKFSCGFVNSVAVTPFTFPELVEPDFEPVFCGHLSGQPIVTQPLNPSFLCFSHRGPPAA